MEIAGDIVRDHASVMSNMKVNSVNMSEVNL